MGKRPHREAQTKSVPIGGSIFSSLKDFPGAIWRPGSFFALVRQKYYNFVHGKQLVKGVVFCYNKLVILDDYAALRRRLPRSAYVP